MKKIDFTTAGAAELMQALYGLDDVALKQEADLVLADFSSWLISKFNFDDSQVNYLNGMSKILLQFTGSQVSFAMRHRLPITLEKPLQRSVSARDTKLIETKTKIDASGDGDGNENAEGEVVIEISY
ncbi:MAG: hypothetical protein REI64_10690 [Pedobacter sp.]|uniref:hypothetical protein n=1 Tax=Pedobacter sp. TaxID=1411316 RepID=UPI002806A8CD|nr:hypothetical protein [Pedobacter sp.]MDQ8005257.1 hypothetical protein [Pedobacter sp.]